MKLKDQYPNFVQAVDLSKGGTDLTRCKSNSTVLSYGMSYRVYGNKLGDIYIDLNKHEDFVYLTFATYKGLTEKARTIGERIDKDIEVGEWEKVISDMMARHSFNPDHTQLVMDFTRKRVASSEGTFQPQKSGCMLIFLLLILPIITYSIINL